MSPTRLTVMAAVACAAGLSLAACSAGITTASQSPSAGRTASTSSAPASSSSSPAASASASADTVSIDSPLRTFPVPPGAQVMYNITCDKETIIELGGVPVSRASSFYTSVLPKNGYRITGNSLINATGDGLPGSAAEIQFTGHGYKGTISALSNLGSQMASAGISPSGLPSGMVGNFIAIDLTQSGAAGCPSTGP